MITHAFRAMNTEWWVRTDPGVGADAARAVEDLVRSIEARLTRFRADSALSRLNRTRCSDDPLVVAVVRRALELRAATDGAFEPGIGSPLADAGYAETFERVGHGAPSRVASAEPGPIPEIVVDGDHIELRGAGAADLGGIAKGWAVDRVADWLAAHGAESYVVDGGGDIRVLGSDGAGEAWPIGAGESQTVHLARGAVCTSSTRGRSWTTSEGAAHHIIDPSSRRPASGGLTEAVVVAPEAATADALATAVLASPVRGLGAVERLGASAMVRDAAGAWRMTTGMTRYLR